jgi:hypothetical protein
VTRERLGQIEAAEARLRELRRWRALRVRHHGDLARLEVAAADLAALVDQAARAGVREALRAAEFEAACLDLTGYRQGALNEALGTTGNGGDETGPASIAARLAGLGIEAQVGIAGRDDDVAVLWPASEAEAARLLAERQAVVTAARSAGYRYAALGLHEAR